MLCTNPLELSEPVLALKAFFPVLKGNMTEFLGKYHSRVDVEEGSCVIFTNRKLSTSEHPAAAVSLSLEQPEREMGRH